MNDMIERVATAIKSALSEGTPGKDPDRMESVARAAIKAMREPTQVMITEGWDKADEYCPTEPDIVW